MFACSFAKVAMAIQNRDVHTVYYTVHENKNPIWWKSEKFGSIRKVRK